MTRTESGREPLRARRRVPVAASVVVMAMALTGCSGGGGDDASAPTTTTVALFEPARPTLPSRNISEGTAACSLLTRAEVEAAAGVGVAAGSGVEREGTGSTCSWALRSDSSQRVSVASSPGDAAAFQLALSKVGSSGERLSGVGDGAIVGDGVAYALKASTIVLVAVDTKQSAERKRATARALVAAAVARV